MPVRRQFKAFTEGLCIIRGLFHRLAKKLCKFGSKIILAVPVLLIQMNQRGKNITGIIITFNQRIEPKPFDC